MHACKYCGKKSTSGYLNQDQDYVCNSACDDKLVHYMKRERKYQNLLFIAYSVIVVIMIVNSIHVLKEGLSNVLVASIGALLFLFPYTRIMKETLDNIAIRRMIVASRVTGTLFMAIGLASSFIKL